MSVSATSPSLRDGDTQPIPVVTGPGRHAAPPPRRPLHQRILREAAIVASLALVGLLLVRLVIGSTTYVPDDSMSPTLAAGERVVVTAFPLTGGVGHGDVIVFEDTGDWVAGPPSDPSPGMQLLSDLGLVPPAPGSLAIGRVVGMSGDRVKCCDDNGRIVVNGQPLDEDFLAEPTDQVPFDVRVPPGRVFVLGDARAVARDSRSFLSVEEGTISLDDVRGRVLMTVWPPTFVDGP